MTEKELEILRTLCAPRTMHTSRSHTLLGEDARVAYGLLFKGFVAETLGGRFEATVRGHEEFAKVSS